MGIFDFMKKKDPLDDLQLPQIEPQQDFPSTDPMSFSPSQSFSQNSYHQQPSFNQNSAPNYGSSSYGSETSRHDELIASKLDVIKALLENLNQRITMLEQKIDMENDRRKRSW
jgi:hypothetical protein